ncbi:MAG: DNA polymerase III subunit beta [Candidatus Magasanikbacteria bacterium]|jgi:DNA polymerase-3 subunit beta
MKFSCTKEKLTKTLSLVVGVAGKNINLPILSNILIKADNQKVEMIATNLELAVVANLRSKTEEAGSFTVPARTLMDFVNLLSDEKVDIELQDSELIVKCGKSSTKIKGSPAEDFPIIPSLEDGKGFMLNAESLKRGLDQVLPAVAKNDIRPELSGVYFGFNTENNVGQLVMAATDSYRLAEKKLKLDQGSEVFKVILPGRTAQEMSRVLSLADGSEETEKNSRILVGENQIALHFDSVQLVSRLVDGQYPDYTQIIPKEFKTTATFATGQMVKEIKAAALFTTTGVNAVSLDLNTSQGSIGVSSTSTQTGEYTSEIPAEISGEENSILLNHRYVLDGLNNMSDTSVALKVISGDSPCLLTPQNDASYLYIVMPIRQ